VRDPRHTHRYQRTRREWFASGEAPTTCCLCGGIVDTTAKHGTPLSPTVEHTVPVRTIITMTPDSAAALDMTCDVSLWRSAHSRCQSQQGARAVNSPAIIRNSSRGW
jgi:hypothetical protein